MPFALQTAVFCGAHGSGKRSQSFLTIRPCLCIRAAPILKEDETWGKPCSPPATRAARDLLWCPGHTTCQTDTVWKGSLAWAPLENRADKLTRATTGRTQTANFQRPLTRLHLLEYSQGQHAAGVTSCPVSDPCSKAEHTRLRMVTRMSLMDKSIARFVFSVIFFSQND